MQEPSGNFIIRIRMSFIARYVYTYKEFVSVTEATAVQQNDSDRTKTVTGLLEGRNCSCVWPFWCSELCSLDQMVTVQRGSVIDVRDPEWFCQPFCSLWISTVLGEWGGLYQWFAQQSGLPFIVFCGQIWYLSWTRQFLMCRGLQ